MYTLYYTPGTCSLSVHIVLREAGLSFDLEKVDLASKKTASDRDFREINPSGYVPALRLDNGEVLTEGVAIVQYLADLVPETMLAPTPGTWERYRLQQWLTFVSSELHKMFSPWLFHPEYGKQAQDVAMTKLAERFTHVDQHLANREFLMGDHFTVADAYLFTIARWSYLKHVELAPFINLAGFLDRVAARPKVREAMVAEGLPQSRRR
jgi:glutathione S-transferase